MIIGSLVMWISLALVSAGLHLTISSKSNDCTLIFVNTIIAGTSGALGTHLMMKYLRIFKLKKEKRRLRSINYFAIAGDNTYEEQRNKMYETKMSYFFNLDTDVEVFNFLRGIIAGAISV